MDLNLGKMKKGVSETHLDRTLEKTQYATTPQRKALNPSFKGNCLSFFYFSTYKSASGLIDFGSSLRF